MVIMAGFNQNHKKPIQVRCSVGHRMTFLAMFQIMFHTYKKPCQCLIIFDLLDGDKQCLYDRMNDCMYYVVIHTEYTLNGQSEQHMDLLVVSHVMSHTDEKPFPCIQCDNSIFLCIYCISQICFIYSKHYVNMKHVMLHTGEKPFHSTECDNSGVWCQFKCSNKYVVMIYHIRFVTEEKNIQWCLISKNGWFGQQQFNLILYMMVSPEEKPFQCTDCDIGTLEIDNSCYGIELSITPLCLVIHSH